MAQSLTIVLRAGIDEAGRGPIIGPLVMCGVVCTDAQIKQLHVLGVKDSKQLKPAEREALDPQIRSLVARFHLEISEPAVIDAAVRSSLSLNGLEATMMAKIIAALQPDQVVIDCPSINIAGFRTQLQGHLTFVPKELILEHKADVNHITAAAASIIAKVERDRRVRLLHQQTGVDFGSGYLTDPKTIPFLASEWKRHAAIFRQSWQPYQDLVKKSSQRSLTQF